VDLPSGPTCFFPPLVKSAYALWIPEIALETMLCVLVVYNGYRTFKEGIRLKGRGLFLVDILIRDSVMYFFMYVHVIWVLATYNMLLLTPILPADVSQCI